MTKIVVDRTCRFLRLAVTIITVFALVISGADAASRLFADQTDAEAHIALQSDQVTLAPEAGTEEETEGMATGSRPWTEQSACFQSVTLLPSTNEVNRHPLAEPSESGCLPAVGIVNPCSVAPSTTCLVSSCLGRQFTLVGAKPSGTG